MTEPHTDDPRMQVSDLGRGKGGPLPILGGSGALSWLITHKQPYDSPVMKIMSVLSVTHPDPPSRYWNPWVLGSGWMHHRVKVG